MGLVRQEELRKTPDGHRPARTLCFSSILNVPCTRGAACTWCHWPIDALALTDEQRQLVTKIRRNKDRPANPLLTTSFKLCDHAGCECADAHLQEGLPEECRLRLAAEQQRRRPNGELPSATICRSAFLCRPCINMSECGFLHPPEGALVLQPELQKLWNERRAAAKADRA
jgi:hypothetical protein